MKRTYSFLVLLLALAQLVAKQKAHSYLTASISGLYSTVNVSTNWTADHNGPHNYSFGSNGIFVKLILLRPNPNPHIEPTFACGFYCNGWGRGPCNDFLFGVFTVCELGGFIYLEPTCLPEVVWSANRDLLLPVGATAELSMPGLVLWNRGSIVWSTYLTSTGMSLDPHGNLRLLVGKFTVWQSFDYPSDVLLSGHELQGYQKLVANVSVSSWKPNPILYLTPLGIYANATPVPQMYYRGSLGRGAWTTFWQSRRYPCYFVWLNDVVVFIANTTMPNDHNSTTIPSGPPSSLQFLRFESDGHLRLRQWVNMSTGWVSTGDMLDGFLDECDYPTVCGSYGICSNRTERCKCPKYFKRQNDPTFVFNCQETTPLSCESMASHELLELQDVNYFQFERYNSDRRRTTPETCKTACLRDCSCKAAIFHYYQNTSIGDCYLPTTLFSLKETTSLTYQFRDNFNSITFLKIQGAPTKGAFNSTINSTAPPRKAASAPLQLVVGLAVGLFVALLLITLVVTAWLKRKKNSEQDEEDEADRLYQLPGMPTRLSYEELTTATDNFTQILGKGGFATVFEGALSNGVRVAVKRLEGVLQITKEFLAEVQIIGRIHHVNLVSLVGFCTERSHRILLYEYMENGSLDRWIFRNDQNEGGGLSWDVRKKIIYQVARGLFYLHEECSPRIYHLDIKPQNILLDGDFNAKVSDFGLSKFIDGGQSFVMTTMRGTPGYLAPEWLLTSKITDKVDVYSFGVVLIEVVCQRRNLDNTQVADNIYLLKLLNNMVGEGRLDEFAGNYCHDVENHELSEAIEMLKLAIWCLQSDADERPTMTMVVKVLEETMQVPDMEMNILSPASRMEWLKEIDSSSSAPLMTSVLSGPR